MPLTRQVPDHLPDHLLDKVNPSNQHLVQVHGELQKSGKKVSLKLTWKARIVMSGWKKWMRMPIMQTGFSWVAKKTMMISLWSHQSHPWTIPVRIQKNNGKRWRCILSRIFLSFSLIFQDLGWLFFLANYDINDGDLHCFLAHIELKHLINFWLTVSCPFLWLCFCRWTATRWVRNDKWAYRGSGRSCWRNSHWTPRWGSWPKRWAKWRRKQFFRARRCQCFTRNRIQREWECWG